MMTIDKAQKILDKEKKVVARQEKFLNSIVWFTTIIFILFGGLIYYWLTAEYKIFTFNEVKVLDEVTTPGDDVHISYNYCKHTDAPVEIISHLVGKLEPFDRPIDVNPERKGCYNRVVSIYILPTRPSDTYYFHYTFKARVNPIRVVEEEYKSPTFKVATESAQPK